MKSRLQAGAQRYNSSIDALLTIIKEEGIAGLYKGVMSKLIQSVLTAAILFAGQRRIYEITKAVGLSSHITVPGCDFTYSYLAGRRTASPMTLPRSGKYTLHLTSEFPCVNTPHFQRV